MSVELKIELYDFRPLKDETRIVLTLDGARIAELSSADDPDVDGDVRDMMKLALNLRARMP